MAGQFLLDYSLSRSFRFRSRVQLLSLRNAAKETGFSASLDGIYKPFGSSFSASSRVQVFETSGYDSRLYGFENDVLYSHSIPAVFGRGVRYYVIAQCRLLRKLSAGLRWARTIYRGQEDVGSGLDMIRGKRKTEIKMQLIYSVS